MKRAAIAIVLPLLTACAGTANQMMEQPAYRSYSSAKAHADIGQCIARSIPATSVLPGTTQTIVKMQGDGGPVDALWRIDAAGNGSTITVWRKNKHIWGIGKAEACF